MMQDIVNSAEVINGSQTSPMIVIINDQVLARTCIVNILKREFTGFEIVEMATASGLGWLSERDVRLIAIDIGYSQITDLPVENRLVLLKESFPNAFIGMLSNRDDESMASAAMQRGGRGLFPTSITVELAVAGLRLVLAGGVYRPLPIVRPNEVTRLRAISERTGASELSLANEDNGAAKITIADLTPREQHVLAALNRSFHSP
jgi:DNA-binding NarL/FixJ family response regulator